MRIADAPRSASAQQRHGPGRRAGEASPVGPLEARVVRVERVRRAVRSEEQRVCDAGTDNLVGCIRRRLPSRRLERNRDVDAPVAGRAELFEESIELGRECGITGEQLVRDIEPEHLARERVERRSQRLVDAAPDQTQPDGQWVGASRCRGGCSRGAGTRRHGSFRSLITVRRLSIGSGIDGCWGRG